MQISPAAFRVLATGFVRSSFPEATRNDRLISTRAYRAFFKIDPLATATLWEKLEESCENEKSVRDEVQVEWEDIVPENLLWVLYKFKTNDCEDVCANLFGVSRNTYRKYFWALVDFLGMLHDETVSLSCFFVITAMTFTNSYYSQCYLDARYDSDNGSECLLSVDGVDFEIKEPGYTNGTEDEYRMWYSHKFSGPGLRYEIGVCIQTGEIVWVAGPFPPGQFTDLMIFDLGLKQELDVGEMVEVDAGYLGPGPVRTPDDYNGNLDWKYMKGKVRARHEQINSCIKQYKILSEKFRYSMMKHAKIVNAVIAIVNSEIEEGRGTHQVDYCIIRDNQERVYDDGM